LTGTIPSGIRDVDRKNASATPERKRVPFLRSRSSGRRKRSKNRRVGVPAEPGEPPPSSWPSASELFKNRYAAHGVIVKAISRLTAIATGTLKAIGSM
jgi:hypothetical protein